MDVTKYSLCNFISDKYQDSFYMSSAVTYQLRVAKIAAVAAPPPHKKKKWL